MTSYMPIQKIQSLETRAALGNVAIVTIAVCCAILLIFADDAAAAIAIWQTNAAYSHCYLILPISLYFIYSRRVALSRIDTSPSRWGGLLFLGALAIWWVGVASSIAEVRQLALVAMLQSAVLCVIGWPMYRRILFPMLYLFLLVPMGTILLGPLQTLTTDLSSALLRLIGIPVFGENHLIEVPHGLYEVAPGCAGLNFLLSTLALSLVYAQLFFRGWPIRAAVVAVALVISIVTNVIRVFGIIWLAELAKRRIDIVDDHLLYGWGVYAIAMLLAMFVGSRFRDPSRRVAEPPVKLRAIVRHVPQLWFAAIAVMIVAGGARAAVAAIGSMEINNPRIGIALPMDFDAWQGMNEVGATTTPRTPVDALVQRSYSQSGRKVDLSIAYYWRQREGYKIDDLAANFVGDGKWSIESRDFQTISAGSDPLGIEATHLIRGNRRMLVWSYYWIGGVHTTNVVNARLLGMRAAIGIDSRSAMVVLATADDDGRAQTILADFLASAGSIDRALTDASLRTE